MKRHTIQGFSPHLAAAAEAIDQPHLTAGHIASDITATAIAAGHVQAVPS